MNFFPVLGEDEEGKMVELDAAQVLSIPRKLKSQEVVRHGFMSNFLFQNISNIFGAVGAVRDIIEKMETAHEEKGKRNDNALQHMGDVPVNENGDVDIPSEIVIGKAQGLFGDKIYENITDQLQPALEAVTSSPTGQIEQHVKKLADTIKDQLIQNVVAPAIDAYNMKKGAQGRIERELSREVDRKFETIQDDFVQQSKIAQAELDRRQREATTVEQVKTAESDRKSVV